MYAVSFRSFLYLSRSISYSNQCLLDSRPKCRTKYKKLLGKNRDMLSVEEPLQIQAVSKGCIEWSFFLRQPNYAYLKNSKMGMAGDLAPAITTYVQVIREEFYAFQIDTKSKVPVYLTFRRALLFLGNRLSLRHWKRQWRPKYCRSKREFHAARSTQSMMISKYFPQVYLPVIWVLSVIRAHMSAFNYP